MDQILITRFPKGILTDGAVNHGWWFIPSTRRKAKNTIHDKILYGIYYKIREYWNEELVLSTEKNSDLSHKYNRICIRNKIISIIPPEDEHYA